MKLKKIASLMLAGVMAVSMLAGCSTGSNGGNNGNGGEGEGEGTVVSGYSATLKDALKGDVKDMDNVTFKDNVDAAALKTAVNNIGSESLKAMAQNNMVPAILDGDGNNGGVALASKPDVKKAIEVFIDAAKITDKSLHEEDMSMWWYANGTNTTLVNCNVKDGVIYVVNGDVDVNEAVKQIAAKLNPLFDELDEKGESSGKGTTWNYDYAISVSVVNKALGDYAGSAKSANFIAVTVDRTVTNG